MIPLGYYTIGRGMRNKQVHFRILGSVEKGLELWIQDYKNTGFLLLNFDRPHAHTNIGPFCVWKNINIIEFQEILRNVEAGLRKKYKSLRWIIDSYRLDEVRVIEGI